MTTNNDYSNFAVIDCGSGKVIEGEEAVPLYMRDNGEEVCSQRKRELETFLKCLETYPLNSVILKKKTVICHDGEEEHNAWWKNSITQEAFMDFLLDSKNHKVNGKIWCNGFLGSRWADTVLNGRKVRIAFYTKKNDPQMFASFPEEVKKGKDYAIVTMVKYHY